MGSRGLVAGLEPGAAGAADRLRLHARLGLLGGHRADGGAGRGGSRARLPGVDEHREGPPRLGAALGGPKRRGKERL